MTRQAGVLLGALVLAHVASAQFVQQASRPGVRKARGSVAATVAAVASGCGESWQVVTPPPTASMLNAVAWTGAQIVAVGSGGTIVTSPDGVTWTARASGTTSDLEGVTWTGARVVAVGSGGTIVTSPDGVTWTSRVSGTQYDLHAVI